MYVLPSSASTLEITVLLHILKIIRQKRIYNSEESKIYHEPNSMDNNGLHTEWIRNTFSTADNLILETKNKKNNVYFSGSSSTVFYCVEI